MLRWRLLAAAVILAVVLGLIWLDWGYNFGRPGLWLAPLALVVTLLAAGEMRAMLAQGGWPLRRWVVYLGTGLVAAAACVPMLFEVYPPGCPMGKLGLPAAGLAAGLILAFWREMAVYSQPGKSVVNVALATFVMAYVGLLMSFLIQLRLLGNNEWGMIALLSTIVVVKVSDTGAYTFGRIFGRTKLIPRLSPGKTVAGAVGGLASACFGSWLVLNVIAVRLIPGAPPAPPLAWVAFGLLVGVAGMAGDLAESLIKRDLGAKDSSVWLPGLGGVLDVVDSILLAAPVAYLAWVGKLVGPQSVLLTW